MENYKFPRDSKIVSTDQVLINDLNNYNTLFGGINEKIDNNATLSARRHARVKECVTASTDSVEFLYPITQSDSVCIESYVVYTGEKSMEIFCKVISEDMITAERKIAAVAFLTFVALDENKKPIKIPKISPQSKEEKLLFMDGEERAKMRKIKRSQTKNIIDSLDINKPWELE
ncbi:acyl-CoA thioesterase [Staphylococcus equorum]|uniref:acyl-CoA thioesterase n=1 Tax=Staphylococcus equorum TaxID=246432 RepID=UPI003D805EC2